MRSFGLISTGVTILAVTMGIAGVSRQAAAPTAASPTATEAGPVGISASAPTTGPQKPSEDQASAPEQITRMYNVRGLLDLVPSDVVYWADSESKNALEVQEMADPLLQELERRKMDCWTKVWLLQAGEPITEPYAERAIAEKAVSQRKFELDSKLLLERRMQAARSGYSKSQQAQKLRALIRNAVEPKSWIGGGGEGLINVLDDVLVVRNSAAVQGQVAALLNVLRSIAFGNIDEGDARHWAAASAESELVMRVYDVRRLVGLDSESVTGWHPAVLVGQAEILAALRSDPVILDLDRRQIELQLQYGHNATAEKQKEWQQQELNLRDARRIREVTLREDLQAEHASRTVEPQAGFFNSRRAENLIGLIKSSIESPTWTDWNGPGSADILDGALVVRNTEAVQAKVAELIAKMKAVVK